MPEQFQQVHDEEEDVIYRCFRGTNCFSLDLIEAISTLTLTKLAFNRNTLPIVSLSLLLVSFMLLSILLGYLNCLDLVIYASNKVLTCMMSNQFLAFSSP